MAYSKTAAFIRSISFSGEGKSNLDKSNLNKTPGKQVAINVDGKGGGDSDSGEILRDFLVTEMLRTYQNKIGYISRELLSIIRSYL